MARKGPSSAATPPLSNATSALLTVIYCITCIAQYLLIRYTKARHFTYDNTSAVLLIEVAKMVVCIIVFGARHGELLPVVATRANRWRKGVWYCLPSLVYTIYNNLTFVNLSLFDAATFQVFMQARIIFTGLLFQHFFKQELGPRKWAALWCLAIGLAYKEATTIEIHSWFSIGLILFQASLSAFAGVFNELLLKNDVQMDVFEQNFYMYASAIVFNIIFGFVFNFGTYSNPSKLFAGVSPMLVPICLNGAAIGIVTSLILKYINVIMKSFASAAEVIITAVMASLLFGVPLRWADFFGCVVVSAAVLMYYLPSSVLELLETPKPKASDRVDDTGESTV